jgi:low affinity Fe/Cu permease
MDPKQRAGEMQQSHRQNERHSIGLFPSFANKASQAAGRATTFALACAVVVVWAVSGPLFGFSDTWQLVINTGTTIVTFLMVFLIQNSQNRDGAAIQVKLDELIRTSAARNSMVGIEHLSAEELEELRSRCEERARTFAAQRRGRRDEDAQNPSADRSPRAPRTRQSPSF